MGERKLCYGCMERTEFSGGVCPNCGYYDKSPSDPSFIIPGTQLNNRYIVGVALFVNGEGITYLAYDQSIGCKVYLREYMPPNLCNRVGRFSGHQRDSGSPGAVQGADGGIHGTAQIAGTPAWTGTR